MTYRSRGRSIFEVILAVIFVGFLVGFITVLCIGNYFRAKRAQERQRQRRLAKLAAAANSTSHHQGGGGGRDASSSRSNFSPPGSASVANTYSPDNFSASGGVDGSMTAGTYEAPSHIQAGVRA